MGIDSHDTATAGNTQIELMTCSNCGLSIMFVGQRGQADPDHYVVYRHEEFIQAFPTEGEFKSWMEEHSPEHVNDEPNEEETLDMLAMVQAVTKAALLEGLRQQYGDNLPANIEERLDQVIADGNSIVDMSLQSDDEVDFDRLMGSASTVFDEFIEGLDLPGSED